MDGPQIIAATLTRPSVPDKFGNLWQYHSRSDRHSKVACWTVLFEVLQHSSVMQRHAADGKVVFGVNREMRDFRTNRTKDLDLVIARPGSSETTGRVTLSDLAVRWNISLTREQLDILESLPALIEGATGSVLVALEAKACMTAHIKALPRLFDELNSSHDTVHGENDGTIAAGFVMINAAETFISPDLNRHDLTITHPVVSEHHQPLWANRALAKVREIQRRNTRTGFGFDAVGVMMVDMRNDGGPVSVVTGDPAPPPGDSLHYEQMVRRIVHLYDTSYGGI
ncbi:MAG TPA: hypothetical protein VHC43_13930 [Mycobacteriales bacterium]|nr:hypothetical protein [Mycobacteriales bacterium]